MRKVFAVALMTAMVGAVGFSQDANAGVSYDYAFRSTDILGGAIGGGTVSGGGLSFTFSSTSAAQACSTADGSGCVVLDVILRTTDRLIAASVSVSFDNSSGLNPLDATKWAGQGVSFNAMGNPNAFFAPLGAISCVGTSCSSFNGLINPPNGPPSLPAGTYNIGTIIWDTSSASGISAVMTEVISGPDGTGAVINGNIVSLTGTESVVMGFINIVPEPATAGLLGMGLAGLVLAGRRRRA